MLSAITRAAAGAARLDKRCPGWADEIDLDTLNLNHGCLCILGQLYGSYVSGARTLGFDPWKRTAESNGFLPDEDHDLAPYDGFAHELNAAWRAEILGRHP